MSVSKQLSRRIAPVDYDDNSGITSGGTPSASVARIKPIVHLDSTKLKLKPDSSNSTALYVGSIGDYDEPSSEVATIATLLNYLSENAGDLLKNQVKMKRFEQITAEVVNNHNDPALHRVVKQHGWNGNKYPRQTQAALDTESYLRALANLYLSQRKAYDGLKSNIPAEESTESEKILSFLPDVLVHHLTSALIIEKSGDISCSTFFGAALLVDISGFSMFAAEKCSHGVAGLNDLHDATNGFLGHLVYIVYRYGGDVVAFAGDALICVFVDHPPKEFEDEISPSNIRGSTDFDYQDGEITVINNSHINENGWKSASKKHFGVLDDINDLSASYVSDDESDSLSHSMSRKSRTMKTAEPIESSERRFSINDRTPPPDQNGVPDALENNSFPTIHTFYDDEENKESLTGRMKSSIIDLYSAADSPIASPRILGLKPTDTQQVSHSYRHGSEDSLSESSMSFNSPIKYRPSQEHVSSTPQKPDNTKSTKIFSSETLGVLSRVMSRKGTVDMTSPIRKSSEDQSPVRSARSSISESSRTGRIAPSNSNGSNNSNNNGASTDNISNGPAGALDSGAQRRPSVLYLDKLEESYSENGSPIASMKFLKQPLKPLQHQPKNPFDPDPYLQKNCCLRALECAMLLREQSAHSGTLTTHIAVSYGEMKLAILGGHNDDWVYLLNGECISELGPCLNAAGKKQVVATRKCYELAMSSRNSRPDVKNASLSSSGFVNMMNTETSNLHYSGSYHADTEIISSGPPTLSSPIGSSDPRITITDISPERINPRVSIASVNQRKNIASITSPISSPASSRSVSGGEEMSNYIQMAASSSGLSSTTTTETLDTSPYLNLAMTTSPTMLSAQRNLPRTSSSVSVKAAAIVVTATTALQSMASSKKKYSDMLSPKLSQNSSSFVNNNNNNIGSITSNGSSGTISAHPSFTLNPNSSLSLSGGALVQQSGRIPSSVRSRPFITTKQVDDNFVIEAIDSDRIPADHPMRLKRILHNSPPTVVDAAKLFVSRPVLSAIYSDSLDRTAELRQVVTMFVSLDSYSPADHKDPLELQPFFKVVQEALHQSGGYLRQFVVDDKGCVVVAMWGVPQFSYSNNSLRGLFCGVAISKRSQQLQLKTSVGLTSGYCYCGCVGGTLRRDYAIIGDQVNMAARFMAKAKGRVLMDMPFRDNLPPNIQHQLTRAETMKLKGARAPVTPFQYSGYEIPVSEVLEDHEGQTTVLRRQVRVMLSCQLDKISNESTAVDQMKQSGSMSMKSVRYTGNSDADRPPVLHNAIATVIIGLPGTGKSTAAQYFEQEARKRNIDCIKIQARPGDESRPYSVVRKLFLELVGIANFREEWQQRGIIREVIKEAYIGSTDEARMTAELTLEIILGLEWSDAFRAHQPEDDSSFPDGSELSFKKSNTVINDDGSTTNPQNSFDDTNNLNYGQVSSRNIGTSVSQPKRRLRLTVGDPTFYNVLKALLKMRKTVIIIEDADYCDELSWNEFHLILVGFNLQLAMMLTMRTPPSNRQSRENASEDRYNSSNHGSHISHRTSHVTSNSRHIRQNENLNDSRQSHIIRAFSTIALFKDSNTTTSNSHHNFVEEIPTVTITRASGETIVVPITEFDTSSSATNPNVDIGGSKYGIRFRPNNSYLSILAHTRCKVIEMNPLNELEINELLHEALQIDVVDPELVMSVLEVTAGNAFWCKAIARFIRENGIEEYSRTIVRRGGNFNSLRALILNRIDRLTDEQRNVAKHAAIIGDEFTLSVLKAILPNKIQTHLLGSLDALQQFGLVYCVEEGHEIIFSFQNQLIRNTIYDLTPPTDADFVHLAVAELLEYQYADDLRQYYPSLSYHYRNSVRNNDEKREQALKYTVKAADQAIARASYPDGLAFLQLAVPFIQTIDEYRTLLEVVRTALEDLAPSRYEDLFNTINVVKKHFLDSKTNAEIEAADTIRYNIQSQYLKLQAELYKAMNKIQANSTDSSSGQTGGTMSRPDTGGTANIRQHPDGITSAQNSPVQRHMIPYWNLNNHNNNNHRRGGGDNSKERTFRMRNILGCMGEERTSQLPSLVNELSYVRTRNSRGRNTCTIM